MLKNIFVWIAPFTLHRSIEWSFRTFMETNHFFEIGKTGHIDEDFVAIVEKAADPEFLCVTYVHVVKNGESGWEDYQEDRPFLRAQFLEHCQESMGSGKLIPGEQKTKWVEADWLSTSLA